MSLKAMQIQNVKPVVLFMVQLFLLLSVFITNHRASANQDLELRVAVHDAFALDPSLIKDFETRYKVKLRFTKLGDAGSMLNRLILTHKTPIADLVYGIDNLGIMQAKTRGLLANYSTGIATHYTLGHNLTPVNYGFITINYDKKEVLRRKLPLPKKLEDFRQKKYRNTLVVQHPATSSPGLAFLVATIRYFGENKAWQWWQAMKENGVKVTHSWSQSYQQAFSYHGGSYPFVVSYATSVAAEVYYATQVLPETPTANLWLPGGCALQVEGIGLLKNMKYPELGKAFVRFMQSPKVQQDMQTQMWVMPAVVGVKIVNSLLPMQIQARPWCQDNLETRVSQKALKQWIHQWIRIMR